MGHALDDTIQDVLIRFKRMQGFDTLWLPGSDHAAISTEMKVVQKIAKEGKTKQDLGREKFLEEAWDWTHEYGGIIQKQQRKLGCSCDWERNRFTLDEGMSDAVLEQFIKLYEKGLIYKGKRMVNWCTSCKTSISDAEVEYKEEPSHLWHIRYKITGTDNKYIIVATTRPETMLGDTAVAVHPDDERYKDLVGKTCILPIMNKEIPIIADEFVEKDFGTGCVKITPAHDMNDYQAGLRHNLEIIEVFDENFKMGNLVPELKGMDLLDARKVIVNKLEQLGALVKTEEYTHNVAKCERCKNTIEPKISTQWFVNMKDLAKRAADSVRNGEMRFVPKRYEKQYFNWLDNIQDWCISRQLWWGHRIPAWYKDDEVYVGVNPPKEEGWVQDEDVLDTWFSSALWPFATLGWPEDTELLKRYYPNNCLVTGYDIIPFWVNRMTFQGEELLGQRPFEDCLIHGLIRDKQGRKFSKSLGNGIDPFDMIEKYGADSLRYYLATDVSAGTDMRFDEDKIKATWNYINKIWNASRFVLTNISDIKEIKPDNLKPEDKWILTKFEKMLHTTKKFMDKYQFNNASSVIYDFVWTSFCDSYIEMAKYSLSDCATKSTLCYILTNILKLLHPFMPYVTEEIYQMLPIKEEESIMISNYPKYSKKYIFELEEEVVDDEIEFIRSFRNVKAENNITKDMKVMFDTTDDNNLIVKMLKLHENLVKEPLGIKSYNVFSKRVKATIFFEKMETEADKVLKETQIAALKTSIARREKLLANENYVEKAPKNIVDMDREKLKEEKEKLALLEK